MKTMLLAFAVLSAAFIQTSSAQTQAADPGWPRVFKSSGRQLSVYQPQVDYWNGYSNIHFRCAIAVKGVTTKEQFGVAEFDANTFVDQSARTVVFNPTSRELRFPNATDAEETRLTNAVNEIRPMQTQIAVALDRVLACLNPKQSTLRPVDVKLDPPKIFTSRQPAILVSFFGNPKFKPVAKDNANLLFALNSNWDIFFDATSQKYFLLNQKSWLTAPKITGPWTPATSLPASLSSLPDDDNWANVRKNIPGSAAKTAPVVFFSTQPAELILLKGDPTYSPIAGTKLMRVSNTDSTLFLCSTDGNYYFLVAGRWFRASNLDGPWSAATLNLPGDFAQIPDNDPSAVVKASVPGTDDAQDAALLASVPTTTTVMRTNPIVDINYYGAPSFKPVAGTSLKYAANSPYSVLLAGDTYYCCNQGVWLTSTAAIGPWTFATSVPEDIYNIPPTSPLFNCTFVVVQSYNDTTITYAQYPGYSGEYVATTGTVMFGAGNSTSDETAQDENDYDEYPDPCYYSYGFGACYSYGYGGYYYPAYWYYGPYGGVSYSTAYNPVTGTYSRSAYAYGPYGNATVKQAYNPYTGGYAQAARVNTAYGSAARGYAYNPNTGNSAWGASRTSAYGSAAAVRTSEGSGAAAWNTQNGQGAVVKTQSGDVYAAKDGTVYKKNSDGSWSQNSGNGWQDVNRNQASAQANQNWQNVQSQDQQRQRGNQQYQRAQTQRAQTFRGGGGGGGRRGGGGGRR
jgi:hypothetical protein